ncbi:MAG: hypothetical protein M0D54_13915 [Hyphomonadaceae bacterium JAD_PAG50586_4]|nr:MAG: hypothetical protein M0D54_13915 [Hyphomonadaceae bacterium JAD_PAG50586_4]
MTAMICMLLALSLCIGALALAAYEVALHLCRQPANDTDAPFIHSRLRTRMRVAAPLLAGALALFCLAPHA